MQFLYLVIYQIKGTTKLHEKGTIIVIDKIVTRVI